MRRSLLVLIGFLAACVGGEPRAVVAPAEGKADGAGTDDVLRYQIGEAWSRGLVSIARDIEAPAADPVLRAAARATARYEGLTTQGTAFYVGRYAGVHLVATNAHVARASCHVLAFVDGSVGCDRVLGAWPEIDFALVAVVDPHADARFAGRALAFAFDDVPAPGRALRMVGFGQADNPDEYMTTVADRDCAVFSAAGDVRRVTDPDEVRPGAERVWSFVTGCDQSHGDSGSAVIDRARGAVLGVVWTGRVPKPARVRDRAYLDGLRASDDPALWTDLSLVVPASRIRAHLAASLAAPDAQLDAEARAILAAFVAGRAD